MSERIAGFVLEEPLARGGAGVVYRGREASSGQPVAVKLLLQQAAVEPRKRFEREAQAMLALDHPHVVRALAAGVDRGRSYLVLELIAGPNLAEVLEREGPLPFDRAARLIAQLARGVEHAHQHGVLHRDLKPENVLLDAQGSPRLTDFGLVRELDPRLSQTRLSQTGMFLGTPGYWAPEQAGGDHQAAGPPTDVHGLGALLFALLTGRAPREGTSLIDVMSQMHRPPPRPSSLRPGVPPALDRLCLRCLEREPRDRPPRAADVADALEAFLREPDRPRSPRAAAWLAACVLILGALVAALVIVRARSPQASAPAAASAAPSTTPAAPATSPAHTPAPEPSPRALPLTPLDAWAHGLTVTRGGWAEAEASMRALIDGAPDARGLARAQAVLALARHYQGDDDQAQHLIEAALSQEPDALTLTAQGELLLQVEPERGLEFVRRALTLDPAFVPALLNLVEPTAETDRGEASILVERAVRLRPDDPLAHYMRALYRGDLESRLADCDRALELAPRFTRALLGRAQVLWAHDRRAEARNDLDEVLRRDPRLPTYVLSSNWARAQGDSDRGIDDLRAALALDPTKADLWEALGDLEGLRDVREAEAAFAEALRLNPNSARALVGRGTSRYRQGHTASALADAERALELAPRDPWALLLRAMTHIDVGDVTGWLSDLRAALAYRGEDRELVTSRVLSALASEACLRSALNEPAIALPIWELLLETVGDHPGFGAMAALDRWDSGDPQGLESLRGLRRDHPQDPVVTSIHALYVARSGQIAEALGALEQTRGRLADDPHGLVYRARAYRACRDPARAREDLNLALQAGPEFAPALVQLANVELRAGRIEAVLETTQRALVTDPGQPMLYVLRASAYSQADQPAEALATLERGLELSPDHPWLLANKILGLRAGERFTEARAIRDALRARELPRAVTQVLDAIDAEGW